MVSQKKLNKHRKRSQVEGGTLTFCLTLLLLNLAVVRMALAGTLPVPALVQPLNDAVLNGSSVDSLSWQPVSGAGSYRVELSTDSTFSIIDSVVVDSTVRATRLLVFGLTPEIYFWRVLAADSTDTSAWSTKWSFTTGPPPPPSLVSPPAQAGNRPSPITLSWSSGFARSFRVQLALYGGDYSFSPREIVVDTTVTSDSLVVGGLGLAQTYYWHVSGQNQNGVSAWSSTSTFYTSYPPSVSILQPAYAAQMDPANITCSWLQPGGAVNYELQVSEDPYYNSVPILDTILAATTAKLEPLKSGMTYYWRVRAESNVGGYWAAWSSSVFYTTLAAPVLKFPANAGQNRSVVPVFRWGDVAGATFYQVQISHDSAFASPVFDSTTSSSVDSLALDTLASNTTFYWHVRGGSNNNGWGNYSATWTFSTSSLPPGAPVLISPPGSALVSPLDLKLSWEREAGADEYRIQLSTDSTFGTLSFIDSTIAPDSLTVDSLDTSTTYFWRIKSGSTSAGWGAFSSFRKFSTTSFVLPSPTLGTPSDKSADISTDVTLRWSAVPHALFYQVEVSPLQDLDTLASNDTTVVDSVPVRSLVRGFKYYWRVRAGWKDNMWGPFSPLWTFTVEPWTQAASFSVDTTMSFPQYVDVSKYKPADYKLFGLPGNTNKSLANLLGGIPGKDWEAYWDDGDTANYLVKYDGSSDFVFGLGNAFWLIHNGPFKINTTLAAAPLDSVGQVKIILHPGWNLITDPYVVDVPWDTVQSLNGNLAGPVWGYDGSFNVSTSLAPFQGYYYFNSKHLNYLLVPYIEAHNAAGKSGRIKKVSSVGSGWTVHITLTADGTTDRSTWFGVSTLAGEGLNRLDVRKPRAFGSEPIVSFDHPEWDRNFSKFASEIHPLFADSSEWKFEVETAPGKPAEISFSGLRQLPEAFDAFLYDPSSGSWTNIRKSMSYSFVPASRSTSFTVLIGKAALVNSLVKNPRALTFRLDDNYPNPFNPTTVIRYNIPAESFVSLEVYNVLGQRVATLVSDQQTPGEHIVEFNGERFASGVYFYRLVAGNHILTGKMVLLK